MVERLGASLLDIEPVSYGVRHPLDLKASMFSPVKDSEVVEAPTFEELFSTLREARLARQTLVNRKSLQTWPSVDPEEKKRVEEILDNSQEIRGHVKLPKRLPPLRINRASELIGAGMQAHRAIFQRLRDFIQPQLEEEFREHARDLKWEVENAIKQVIVSGRINDEEQIRSDLKEQFGVTGESRIQEVRSVMTGEEIQKYEKNVQAHLARLRHRLSQRGVDLEDAAQEARLAVFEAINHYNPELGKFPPYLFTIINGRLHDLMRAASPMSRSEQRNLRTISEFEQNFESEKGRPPTIEEIELATGIRREEIQDIKEFPSVFTMADLREDMIKQMEREDHVALRDEDSLVEPEEYLLEKEDVGNLIAEHGRITTALSLLTERDSVIIRQYNFKDLPFWKVGENLGLSESRVCQLHKRALARLKKMLTTGVSLKVFLHELGISYASFDNNRLGEGLTYQHAGRAGARLGPVEMLTIKKRVEAHKQQVVENREARKERTAKRNKAEKRRSKRQKEIKHNVKNRLRGRHPQSEKVNGHRPKEYKPVKPEDLEVLLELYGDQLKDKEMRVLRLRSGLEDGVLWTMEETAIAINLKTATGVAYIERIGLGKLRKLEPSVFEYGTSK